MVSISRPLGGLTDVALLLSLRRAIETRLRRKSVCGLDISKKDIKLVDGPLGELPLDRAEVQLIQANGKGHDMIDPTRVMHLATWLWSRPLVANLDLSACQPLSEEVPRVVCAALAAGSLPALTSVNVDGVALPVRMINGTDKQEVRGPGVERASPL